MDVQITDEDGTVVRHYQITAEGGTPTAEDILRRALRMTQVGITESHMKRTADGTGWLWGDNV